MKSDSAMREVDAVRVAIIGGGLTGTLLCMQLLRCQQRRYQIHLFEKTPQRWCRGVAYSSALPYQLLNVPAGKMSLFEDQPDDFVQWLQAEGHDLEANDFVPRRLFGDYLTSRFNETRESAHSHQLLQVAAEVKDIEPYEKAWRVHASDEDACIVDRVYLCTGNFQPAALPGVTPELEASGHYVAMPWDGRYLAQVRSNDTVLVAGTGLSMVDQVMSLQRLPDFEGKVIALSRRGLLPLPHAAHSPYMSGTLDVSAPTARGLATWFQDELRRAEEARSCFRAVVDALRPQIPALWQALAPKERARFLRHLRPFWEIHRHRIPAQTAAQLDALQHDGKLEVVAGRIRNLVYHSPDRIEVEYLPRRAERRECLNVNWVINCTGPQTPHRQLESPLYRNLCQRGLLQPDPSGLGIRTTTSGQALLASGDAEPRLTLVGPPAKATLWESTALQEISAQVNLLVRQLDDASANKNAAGVCTPAASSERMN